MNIQRVFPIPFICLVFFLFFSCKEKPVSDRCCVFSDLASTAADDDDQGAVQVDGSTGAYFYAFDETGEQVGYQSLNHVLRLPPGRYQVRVNNTQWPVEVQSGRLARCATGTVLLTGSTADLFQVSDSTGNPLGAETLGKSMSFFPGAYTVKVNNTEAAVVVKPMQLTVVKTGTLVVHGDTGEFYYVLNSADDQLNNNIFERPLAFLPGTYPVKVNKTTRNAEVFAGQVTELSTGTVLVKGMTEEHYYVTNTLGSALNYQRLNKALAFFPGPVHIRINNTMMNGLVSAGQTSEFITGSLMLTGGGTEYYYVLDDQGNSLNYNALNKSLSLFPADYVVKIGGNMRKATVNPGQLTTIDAFE